jgi:hypothetical protein
MPPALLCIAPDIVQERRIMRMAQMGGLTHIPEMVLWTSTELLLNEYGPIAPNWLKHIPQDGQEGQPDGLRRQKIFALVPTHMST